MAEERVSRVRLPESLYAVRYAEGSMWEIANKLGEIRMILHSVGAETDGLPCLLVKDPYYMSAGSLKAFIGYRVSMENARGILSHVRLPAGIYLKAGGKGGTEKIVETVKSLIDEASEGDKRPEQALIVFKVNPLDYPEHMLTADIYVKAASE